MDLNWGSPPLHGSYTALTPPLHDPYTTLTAPLHQSYTTLTLLLPPSLTATTHHLPQERVQAIKSGRRLLFEVFQNAEPHSLVLTLMSSLKDAALFLRDNQSLFLDKIRYITVMGAVKPYTGRVEHIEADCATAQNNSYDEHATNFFYKRCQVGRG